MKPTFDIKALVEKWKDVISEGKKIENPKIVRATALMLENQHNYLMESSNIEDTLGRTAGYTTSGDFHKIAVPMVRRTFPELIAHEIVGVQPLTGPVGLAFALRFKAGQTYNATANTELGYNTIDYNYTLTTPASAAEALGSKRGTAGTNVVADDVGIGIGTGQHIKEVNMTVEKAQVEAKTRKLRSRWSLEVAQDLKAMHGLDLEEEMMDILAYEITAEIDRELIAEITTAATSSSAVSSGFNYDTADGRWEAEKYRVLYNMIIRKANDIAITTRRGAGNYCIAHPTICAALEATSAFTIAPVSHDVTTAVTGVARLGSLDGRMAVYRDTFATSEGLIIGYKGPSEYDTGIIYLPYIQLLANKIVFEDSFNPAIGLMSRYAIHSHIFGAALYYRYVKCHNMP